MKSLIHLDTIREKISPLSINRFDVNGEKDPISSDIDEAVIPFEEKNDSFCESFSALVTNCSGISVTVLRNLIVSMFLAVTFA